MASELLMNAVYHGQQLVSGPAPDVQYYAQATNSNVEHMKELLPTYRTRPSLLGPVVWAAGMGCGAAAALMPRTMRNSFLGTLNDSISEAYVDELRSMLQGGMESDLRVLQLLKRMRDAERAPEGASAPPSATRIETLADVAPEQVLGAAVRTLYRGMRAATATL